jgi:drug/metabolite transporter (DMT)-like permease
MIDIIITFALIASGTTANKYLLIYLQPTFFTAIRMLSAGAILAGYHAFFSPRFTKEYLRADLKILFGISFFTTFIPSALKAFALKYLNSSQASLLGSIDPFVTALYAYLLLGERLSWLKIVGLCGGTLGILYQVVSTRAEQFPFFGGISWPEIAVFANVLLSRYGWIRAQKLLRAERYMPSELNGIMMIAGGFYALLLAAALGECGWCAVPDGPVFWLSGIYTIVIGNIIAYTMYSTMLRKHSATLVSLAGLTVPLFVHLYGPLIIGEPLSLSFFISLGIVAGSLTIFYFDELRRLGRESR